MAKSFQITLYTVKKKTLCHNTGLFFFASMSSGKMTILTLKLMDFFTELYLSRVGTILMLLVMTDKFAFKMWWKQFLLVPFLLLFSSLSVMISVVRQGFPYQLHLAAP